MAPSVFDLELLALQLGKMLLAFVLCFPMAWDRERRDRSLGVRTIPLVSVASCAFALVAADGSGSDAQSVSRVMQGIIAGIGFLGGGAIVKQGVTVRGAATAASVWATAALGVAVAMGEIGIAVALGLVGYGTLRWLQPLKRAANEPRAEDDQDDEDNQDDGDAGERSGARGQSR